MKKELLRERKFFSLIVQHVKKPVEEIPNRYGQRQYGEPVLPKQGQPLIPVGQAFVLHKLPKKDIAPDRTQPKGDRIKDQPEDDIFSLYCCTYLSVFEQIWIIPLTQNHAARCDDRAPDTYSSFTFSNPFT